MEQKSSVDCFLFCFAVSVFCMFPLLLHFCLVVFWFVGCFVSVSVSVRQSIHSFYLFCCCVSVVDYFVYVLVLVLCLFGV